MDVNNALAPCLTPTLCLPASTTELGCRVSWSLLTPPHCTSLQAEPRERAPVLPDECELLNYVACSTCWSIMNSSFTLLLCWLTSGTIWLMFNQSSSSTYTLFWEATPSSTLPPWWLVWWEISIKGWCWIHLMGCLAVCPQEEWFWSNNCSVKGLTEPWWSQMRSATNKLGVWKWLVQ